MKDSISINRDEIAHLAYLNWQKDGCPQGRDQAYWLEAEHQLKATKHLLAGAHAAPAQVQKPLLAVGRGAQTKGQKHSPVMAPEPPANGPKAAVKSKAKGTRKTSARSELARSI